MELLAAITGAQAVVTQWSGERPTLHSRSFTLNTTGLHSIVVVEDSGCRVWGHPRQWLAILYTSLHLQDYNRDIQYYTVHRHDIVTLSDPNSAQAIHTVLKYIAAFSMVQYLRLT